MSILTWFRDFFDSGFWAAITNAFVRLCGNEDAESGQSGNPANSNGATQVDGTVEVGRSVDLEEVVSLSDSSSWVTVDSESMTSNARIHEWLDDVASGSPSRSPSPFPGSRVAIKNKRTTELQKRVKSITSIRQKKLKNGLKKLPLDHPQFTYKTGLCFARTNRHKD
ncbi:hypothetical protein ACHAPQ_012065 [Fusarium lateritium]